jgi:hypothetical protein
MTLGLWPMRGDQLMLDDETKATGGMPVRGEAKRHTVRRPRVDRDGLFLFGRRWAAQTVSIAPDELTALLAGKTIAIDVLGEYVVYVSIRDAADKPRTAHSHVTKTPQ